MARYNPDADPRVETQCERCGTWFVLNPWQLPVTSCFNCEGKDVPAASADQHGPFDGTGETFGNDVPGWSDRTAETAARIGRPAAKPATDRQRAYLFALETDRVAPDGYIPAANDPTLTGRDASARIDALKGRPRNPRPDSPAAPRYPPGGRPRFRPRIGP